MALVGSGTLKIQDHVTEGDFRAGSLDTSLAAIVREVGGTYWQNGVPVTTPGNLDGANIAIDVLPNSVKAQPYSLTTLVLTKSLYPPLPTFSDRTVYAVLVPQDVVAVEAVLALNATGNEVTVTGTAEVCVNGVKVGTIAAPGTISGFAASRSALQNIALRRGDVLTVDLAGISVSGATAYAYNPTVTVWCKALHV
jgi:hypothetical protein